MPILKYRNELPRSKQLQNLGNKCGLRNKIFASNKNYYIGEWDINRKNGSGLEFNRKNQIIYDGNWNAGNRNHFGTSLLYQNNIYKISYRGMWKSNSLSGIGTQFSRNGTVYRGEMFKGERNGFGLMWNNDGSFYAGNWKNGMKSGLGILIYESGNRYEGQWKRGLKDGKGTFYHLSKCGTKLKAVQIGLWSNDVCVQGDVNLLKSSSDL